MNIDLALKYPLYIKRGVQVWILDSAGIPVAQAIDYNRAYELVRLANCADRLMSDLSETPPHENPASTVDRPRRPEIGGRISDPAKTDRLRDHD